MDFTRFAFFQEDRSGSLKISDAKSFPWLYRLIKAVHEGNISEAEVDSIRRERPNVFSSHESELIIQHWFYVEKLFFFDVISRLTCPSRDFISQVFTDFNENPGIESRKKLIFTIYASQEADWREGLGLTDLSFSRLLKKAKSGDTPGLYLLFVMLAPELILKREVESLSVDEYLRMDSYIGVSDKVRRYLGSDTKRKLGNLIEK